MRYAFLVAWREYAENIKTKGFWIGLCLLPLMLFLSIRIPILLEQKGTPVRYFVLVDQSKKLDAVVEAGMEKFHQRSVMEALNDYSRRNAPPRASAKSGLSEPSPLEAFKSVNPQSVEAFMAAGGKKYFLDCLKPALKPDAPGFDEPRRAFQRVKLPAGSNPESDTASLIQGLRPYLRGEKRIEAGGRQVELYAAILIPRDIENLIVRPRSGAKGLGNSTNAIQYWSVNLSGGKHSPASPGSRLDELVEQTVDAEVRRGEYLARGLDSAAFRQVEETYISFASFDPKKEAGRETVNDTDILRHWAPSGFVYLLWIAIFGITQMLLTNTIEEKSNRIMEVLLSSVTPGELMMGKLFGIAAVGLTLVAGWMLALVAIVSWQAGGSSGMASQLLSVLKTSSLIPMFMVYFFSGYLLYGALILSLGSVCNTLKEAQNYMSMITMLMIVPLLTMTFIPKDPNGTLARVLSWIPIYTPFTMLNRATADPPLVDLIGTMVLMLVSVGGALWMGGKIFRRGILRTGQPPRFIEMLRWLKG